MFNKALQCISILTFFLTHNNANHLFILIVKILIFKFKILLTFGWVRFWSIWVQKLVKIGTISSSSTGLITKARLSDRAAEQNSNCLSQTETLKVWLIIRLELAEFKPLIRLNLRTQKHGYNF